MSDQRKVHFAMSNTNTDIIYTSPRQAENATKRSIRRSFRANFDADEVGQNCRAAFMQDLLAQAPRLAAMAEVLLASDEDAVAIEALEAFVGNAREVAKTLRVFREAHEARQKRISHAEKERGAA